MSIDKEKLDINQSNSQYQEKNDKSDTNKTTPSEKETELPSDLTQEAKKARPKSVSFHSGSHLPLERRISTGVDCLRYIINGSSLIKVKANSRQYRRFFSLEENLAAIRWIPSSKKSSKARLSIRRMKEVRMGKSTEVLRSKELTDIYPEDCAFSVIHSDNFESLDLVASTPDEANIWVTALNMLLGASRSPDTLDERQKMRDKWLKDVFSQADTEQKGQLDPSETICLMKKLNTQLSMVKLQQKLMELEHDKDEQEKGRICSSDFVNLFKEATNRPEIYFVLVRFSGKDYMNLEDLQLFLEGEQEMYHVSQDKCLQIINHYEPSHDARKNQQLLIDGFTRFLMSDDCSAIEPVSLSVNQDMTQPLTHYFISTCISLCLDDSTYSETEFFIKALESGYRCIKVECCSGSRGLYVGNTLLVDVLYTIRKHAFTRSEYPLIIYWDDHCAPECQKEVAKLLKTIFSPFLYIPDNSDASVLKMSPQELGKKILLKGRKIIPNTSPQKNKNCLVKELSDLIAISRTQFIDLDLTESIFIEPIPWDLVAFPEEMASQIHQLYPEDLVRHNRQFLGHVAPITLSPLALFAAGYQFVAMSLETMGQMTDLYRAWFSQNGQCGFVLKPAFMTDEMTLSPTLNAHEETLTLNLKIISGQQLPQPRGTSTKASSIDPFVIVQLFGIPADCAEARTKTVPNEGHSPIFDESFEFTITVPHLAVLRLVVLDDDFIDNDFIGQNAIPVRSLQPGYHHVSLLSEAGILEHNATLFVHISISTTQKNKRKKQASLKNVGVRQIDESFKNVGGLMQEANRLKLDVELAMLELCKECALPDGSNLVQCLRVIVLRLASCSNVASFSIVNDNEFPNIRVKGELSSGLHKSIALLEKVLTEFKIAIDKVDGLLNGLSEVFNMGILVRQRLPTSYSEIKGRKMEKMFENFLWNMSQIKLHTELLGKCKASCLRYNQQMISLGPLLTSVYQRERESHQQTSPLPTLSQFLFPPQPALTPTSPSDGRLRSILKKSSTAPASQSESCPPPNNNKTLSFSEDSQHSFSSCLTSSTSTDG